MPANVFVTFSRNLQETYRRMSAAINPALRAQLEEIGVELSAYIKAEKLSGQVLKTRTGTLRRSITHKVHEKGRYANTLEVGTNVEYAAIHEFGFKGTVRVPSHDRVVTMAFGKPLKEPVTANVRAHNRHVEMPERSFLRSSVADHRDEIRTALRAAVRDALEEASRA
jgi:phage gpG-like protein